MFQHAVDIEKLHLAEVEELRLNGFDAVAIDVDEPHGILLIGGGDVGAQRSEVGNIATHRVLPLMVGAHHSGISVEESRSLRAHGLRSAGTRHHVHHLRCCLCRRHLHVGVDVALQSGQRLGCTVKFLLRERHGILRLAVVEQVCHLVFLNQRAAAVVGDKRALYVTVVAEIAVSLKDQAAHVGAVGLDTILLQFVGEVGTQVGFSVLTDFRGNRTDGLVDRSVIILAHRQFV